MKTFNEWWESEVADLSRSRRFLAEAAWIASRQETLEEAATVADYFEPTNAEEQLDVATTIGARIRSLGAKK